MSTRIKGASLLLSLGSPAVDYMVDISKSEITNEEKSNDVTTFGDVAANDDRTYFLNASAVQSTDVDSLWDYIWENAGTEVVAYTYAPHGNAVASAAQPHFTGTLTIGPPPTIGGEAGKENTYTFEFQWELDAKPTKDIGV